MTSLKTSDIDLDDPKFRIKPYQQMIASCTGALIPSFFVTPLDIVKIRLQTQQKAMLSNKCFLYCNGLMDHICSCGNGQGGMSQAAWLKANGKFTGTLDALVKICEKEGIRSLWSGLSPTLVLAVPATIVYFVSYEQLRLFIKVQDTMTSLQSQDYDLSSDKLQNQIHVCQPDILSHF